MSRYALIGIILGVFLPVISGCQVDSFYVDNASLSEISDHRLLRDKLINYDEILSLSKTEMRGLSKDGFSVIGHRIISDGGTVFGYREFSGGFIPLVDQGDFLKLTIYLPFLLTNQTPSRIVIKDSREVLVFWSRGSANFPDRSGCYGYASDGHINLSWRSSEEVEAELDVMIDSVSPRGWKEECQRFPLRKKFLFAKQLASMLTPWEGRRGNHIYDESIR
ncbi:MAG: hypothetical protein HOP32_05620 [Nitrospira sp.]|nr:hypothetical protein [Nitrospira sp.]